MDSASNEPAIDAPFTLNFTSIISGQNRKICEFSIQEKLKLSYTSIMECLGYLLLIPNIVSLSHDKFTFTNNVYLGIEQNIASGHPTKHFGIIVKRLCRPLIVFSRMNRILFKFMQQKKSTQHTYHYIKISMVGSVMYFILFNQAMRIDKYEFENKCTFCI